MAIDRLIDPTFDSSKVVAAIDAIVSSIEVRVPPGAKPDEKLSALMTFLYAPGSWNDFRPFQYDLNDPMGENISNKVLANYLVSRKGNCVSMPILLLILADKLGLDVALATAPAHMFVKYRDQSGKWVNIEATSGGYKADEQYVSELSITPLALKNAIYLRPLNKREAVGAMAGTLMEFYGSTSNIKARLAVADVALSANPRDTVAMLHKGNAYFRVLKRRYLDVYPTPRLIPHEGRQEFSYLSKQNHSWFQKAEALGWVEPSSGQEAIYKEQMNKLKEGQE